MNANNTYFENLKCLGHEYEERRAAHESRKQHIIDTYGWDSEELKTWCAEKEAMKFPFEQGTCKAYRAFTQSLSRKEDELEMDDFLWDKEVKDFIDALRGWKTFTPLLRRAARCLAFAPSRDRKPAGETRSPLRSWASASS